MSSTIAYYTGDGSTTSFEVPFDYLKKPFIKVYIDAVLKTGGDSDDTSVDYYFSAPDTIKFLTAPSSGSEVIIRRYTSATERVISFQDASILKASDLDISAIQNLHIAEEARDVSGDSITKDDIDDQFNALNKRIKNVADPVDGYNAVNKKYVDEAVDALDTFENYKKTIGGYYEDTIKARDIAVTKASEASASATSASEDATEASKALAEIREIDARISETDLLLGTTNQEYSVEITEDKTHDFSIAPDGLKYIVGRHQLIVAWNCMFLRAPTHYAEVGTTNTVGTSITIKIPCAVGDVFDIHVCALGGGINEETQAMATSAYDLASSVSSTASEAKSIAQTSNTLATQANTRVGNLEDDVVYKE